MVVVVVVVDHLSGRLAWLHWCLEALIVPPRAGSTAWLCTVQQSGCKVGM